MAYAPNAIRAAGNRIVAAIPGAVFSGIVGDVNHSYGYHLGRNECPAGDYSCLLPRDQGGNASAASALDIKLPPDQMIAVTGRLDAAAKARVAGLSALREFAGTLNGSDTYAYDLSNGRPAFGTWDDTHLWHIHLSGYRDSADDAAAWDAIADIFIGSNSGGSATGGGTPIDDTGTDLSGGLGEDEMSQAQYDALNAKLDAIAAKQDAVIAKQIQQDDSLYILKQTAEEDRPYRIYAVRQDAPERAGEAWLVAVGYKEHITDPAALSWFQSYRLAGQVIIVQSAGELDGILSRAGV